MLTDKKLPRDGVSVSASDIYSEVSMILSTRWRILFIAMLSIALVAAIACASDEEEAAAPAAPAALTWPWFSAKCGSPPLGAPWEARGRRWRGN